MLASIPNGAAAQAPIDCGDQGANEDCIGQHFRTCEPAIQIVSTPELRYRYEILGPTGAGCAVRVRYLAYPNPRLVGPEMTCTWDSAKPFTEEVSKLFLCTGPLSDLSTAPVNAIKQVIERKTQAQAQALASKDPSPLRTDATDDYYANLIANYHDLIDSGVVSLKLGGVQCGIIVFGDNGTTATATCAETWSTTFVDDAEEAESTDLNQYTLVERGDTWKIQADRPRPR